MLSFSEYLKEGFVSHAQRKAVWASKHDGGKGHPDNKKKKKVKKEETEVEFGIYEGRQVPLEQPMLEIDEEENKPLNSPKRGGPKKFYVYVKDGDKVKKVTFGDTTGLTAKINDPEARKSFAARHQCSTQKDKTSAAYWSCNLPRYADKLGLSGGGNYYW